MSSAFMDMNMEVGMEENPFEDGGMTAESPEKKKAGFRTGLSTAQMRLARILLSL